MRTKTIAIAFTIVLGASQVEVASGNREWPPVAPLDRSYDVKDADHAKLALQILSPENKALYLLECQGREEKIEGDFEFSGDFECRLSSLYSTERYSTLLTENPKQQKDWESRGRFDSDELEGRCADYPEFGRVRNFRLRGMKIRLEMSNVSLARGRRPGDGWDSNLLRSLHFRVTVQPDKSAMSPIAERVPYKRPPELYPGKDGSPLDCSKVRRVPPDRGSRNPQSKRPPTR